MHIKVRESFAYPLLGWNMTWKGAAGIGCEELPGTLQHERDLTHLGKELLPLQGVT